MMEFCQRTQDKFKNSSQHEVNSVLIISLRTKSRYTNFSKETTTPTTHYTEYQINITTPIKKNSVAHYRPPALAPIVYTEVHHQQRLKPVHIALLLNVDPSNAPT